MDLDIIILSEVSQTKTNVIWYYLYAESKENDTNKLIYKRDTDSQLENEFMITRGKEWGYRLEVWD